VKSVYAVAGELNQLQDPPAVEAPALAPHWASLKENAAALQRWTCPLQVKLQGGLLCCGLASHFSGSFKTVFSAVG
jgi:hypothetical protein